MKKAVILAAAVALAGCSTAQKSFYNLTGIDQNPNTHHRVADLDDIDREYKMKISKIVKDFNARTEELIKIRKQRTELADQERAAQIKMFYYDAGLE